MLIVHYGSCIFFFFLSLPLCTFKFCWLADTRKEDATVVSVVLVDCSFIMVGVCQGYSAFKWDLKVGD